jgi:hypothetical protein
MSCEIYFPLAAGACFALPGGFGAGNKVCRRDSGRTGSALIMVVDDDRLYPRDAFETYLYYSEQLPNAALCFRDAWDVFVSH